MRIFAAAFAVISMLGLAAPADAKPCAEFFGSERGFEGDALKFLQDLDYRQGMVEFEDAGAIINVPNGYYLLDSKDARAVLEEAWGNPPDESTFGMLFPKYATPLDQDLPWGIVISFEDIGFVSDDDAESADYDALIKQMEASALASNAQRKQSGYSTISAMQWAERPHYERQHRIVHWAKKITWGEGGETLNYDVRMLGRYGVLSMSYIASVDALPTVKASIPDVLEFASYKEGSTYEEYNSWFDTAAGVGIAGLVAGKVASKAGLFAIGLVLLKKFGVFLLVPLAFIGRLFKRNRPEA